MGASGSGPLPRRLIFSFRRLVHSAAYFLASFVTLSLFFAALMLAESGFYALTGHALSFWALILAAVAAALLFSPAVHLFKRLLDRLFFRRHLDILDAIRHLGAGDLADLPSEGVEPVLLERLCRVSHRRAAALAERDEEGECRVCRWPADAPEPPESGAPPGGDDYELCLPLPLRTHRAWLYLGPRTDGWPTEPDEVETLDGVAQFAAMSLEHARLSHMEAEAARLDSISRVASQLHSHDLKNRLNDLAFLAHNIAGGGLEERELQRLVGAIRKVVARMQTLMQRMNDPNAPLHPVIQPLDVASLLRASVEHRLWPEGVRVQTDLPPLPPVAGDETLLHGVFENLYDNAVQAMQGRGTLRVAASPTGSGEIEVRISDSGCGMSADFLEHRLFRLFATNKPNGLGIGLYLGRRIVAAHGGGIAADSAGEGKGSTFRVRLPLWQGDGEEG